MHGRIRPNKREPQLSHYTSREDPLTPYIMKAMPKEDIKLRHTFVKTSRSNHKHSNTNSLSNSSSFQSRSGSYENRPYQHWNTTYSFSELLRNKLG